MKILLNAATAVLVMGAALGAAWAFRPASMPVAPHYGPVVAPYDTMTWTPTPPSGSLSLP